MISLPPVLCLLLASALVNVVEPRPPSPVGFFPSQAHPWSIDSKNAYEDENLWGPIVFSDSGRDPDYYYKYDSPQLKSMENEVIPKNKFGPNYYSSGKDGFVPNDLKELNNVYWWKKRFQGINNGEDLPYYENMNEANLIDNSLDTAGDNKRDYTAAQLVNMLKGLAKARRQRQIRITGKGMRFGISK